MKPIVQYYLTDNLIKLGRILPEVANKIESSLGTKKCHKLLKNLLTSQYTEQELIIKTYQHILVIYTLHTAIYSDYNDPLILKETCQLDLEFNKSTKSKHYEVV